MMPKQVISQPIGRTLRRPGARTATTPTKLPTLTRRDVVTAVCFRRALSPRSANTRLPGDGRSWRQSARKGAPR